MKWSAGRRRPKRQTGTVHGLRPTGPLALRALRACDGALRVGVFDASESYGHARRARRVGYIAVIGSEGRRSSVGLLVVLYHLPVTLSLSFDRSRVDLGPISTLGSISTGRYRSDLGTQFDLGSISVRSQADL